MDECIDKVKTIKSVGNTFKFLDYGTREYGSISECKYYYNSIFYLYFKTNLP